MLTSSAIFGAVNFIPVLTAWLDKNIPGSFTPNLMDHFNVYKLMSPFLPTHSLTKTYFMHRFVQCPTSSLRVISQLSQLTLILP